MIVVKILGKVYNPDEIEHNSKIVRKWFVLKQVNKERIVGKYHTIEDCTIIEKLYTEAIESVCKADRDFYEKYLQENWKETHPILKDVSSYEKIRPKDGIEFCMLI